MEGGRIGPVRREGADCDRFRSSGDRIPRSPWALPDEYADRRSVVRRLGHPCVVPSIPGLDLTLGHPQRQPDFLSEPHCGGVGPHRSLQHRSRAGPRRGHVAGRHCSLHLLPQAPVAWNTTALLLPRRLFDSLFRPVAEHPLGLPNGVVSRLAVSRRDHRALGSADADLADLRGRGGRGGRGHLLLNAGAAHLARGTRAAVPPRSGEMDLRELDRGGGRNRSALFLQFHRSERRAGRQPSQCTRPPMGDARNFSCTPSATSPACSRRTV